jgi:hypothetical protein
VPTKDKNDKQNPYERMMIEEQRNLNTIKKMNKGEKLGHLISLCPKLLKDGLMQDVESVCNV